MSLKYDIISTITVLFLLISFSGFTIAADNTTEGIIEIITPDEVEMGDQFTVEVVLAPSAPVLLSDEVTLIVRTPGSSRASPLITLTPDNDGLYETTILADVTGAWTITAKYGDASKIAELSVVPRNDMIKTKLDLNPYGSRVEVMGNVQMSGRLTGPDGQGIPYQDISYEVGLPSFTWGGLDYSDNDRVWSAYGTTKTSKSGQYTFSFKAYDNGIYGVRTKFAGDETYAPSSSKTVHFRSG